ncbi:MAG: radical SAM/SPASM domain-containing protein [Myxococcales bacterium]|nr:radical SAM/SPASM domain-containing protein [Myxococcales bacterium]MCB9644858.1 radical SAM/SPASM domain-containing protein [Myxococcales bacterium]
MSDTLFDLDRVLEKMAIRPFELHFELTNLCNAKCIFCPYQFQERKTEMLSDEIFYKAVEDYVAISGGSVGLTPIVGDALIDPKFLERVRYLRSLPQIDRIFVTTNAILLDKFGIAEILHSGLDTINISTSGFDKESYVRLYQNASYERMRRNVLSLVEENDKLKNPLNITVCLRSDRPLKELMKDPDFQPILAYEPAIDFTWSYTSAGQRITREILPQGMELRTPPPKKEPCVNLYNGVTVLTDGNVMACSCVAAMDAVEDLSIGNIMEESLLEIYTGKLMKDLRAQFRAGGTLNPTCAACDMYQDLELYRTREGRKRATINLRRQQGEVVKRDRPKTPFQGG